MNRLQCAIFSLYLVRFTSGSTCPRGGYNNSQPQFGLGCMYRCHCVNDEQCNYDTGECRRGCAAGWMGPGCQYGDIAFGKTSSQKTTYNTYSGPEKAVDGDVSTCSQTTSQYEQWWRVDLGNTLRISELIVISKGTDNLNGLEVRLGNDSSDAAADYPFLCFKHNSNDTIQTVENVRCQKEVAARHIILWMPGKSTLLSLCDVRAYGGRSLAYAQLTKQSTTETNHQALASRAVDGETSASWGDMSCTHTINETAPWWRVDLGQIYHIMRMKIFNRQDCCPERLSGFAISFATKCEYSMVFKYSDETPSRITDITVFSESMAKEIEIKLLDKTNFLTLCEVFVYGDCPENLCGWSCELHCLCGGIISRRNKIDAICPEICSQGWWGPSCNFTCSYCSVNSTCNKDDGRCSECATGRWGKLCQNNCKNCLTGTGCNITDGVCIEGCLRGFYGVNCDKSCSTNCAIYGSCDRHTGLCTHGCVTGWISQNSDNGCLLGWYGVNCSEKCGQCAYATCDRVDGICPFGCADGYNGTKCLEKIPSEVIPNEMDGIKFSGPVIGIIIGISLSALIIGVGFGILLMRIFRSRYLENTQEDHTYDDLSATQVHSDNYAQLEILALKRVTPDDDGVHSKNITPKTATHG